MELGIQVNNASARRWAALPAESDASAFIIDEVLNALEKTEDRRLSSQSWRLILPHLWKSLSFFGFRKEKTFLYISEKFDRPKIARSSFCGYAAGP